MLLWYFSKSILTLINPKNRFKRIASVLICVASLWMPVLAYSPVEMQDYEPTLILIQGTALKAISGPLVGIEAEIWWMAHKYGLDYKLMYDLAVCECNLQHENCWGDYSSLTNSYLAYGIYQWHQDSWDDHNEWLGLDLDRTKLVDQIEMTALVLKNDGQHNWKNCWQKITRE